jgi:hypothetical protein
MKLTDKQIAEHVKFGRLFHKTSPEIKALIIALETADLEARIDAALGVGQEQPAAAKAKRGRPAKSASAQKPAKAKPIGNKVPGKTLASIRDDFGQPDMTHEEARRFLNAGWKPGDFLQYQLQFGKNTTAQGYLDAKAMGWTAKTSKAEMAKPKVVPAPPDARADAQP